MLPNISSLIENFAGVKVLIIGDLMLDRYLWGSVSRISPEAPVPIVNIQKTSLVLGGAANVAANVAGLGAKPFLVGVTGEDPEADALTRLLENSGISADFLFPIKTRPTTIKTRLVAHNQHVVRFDRETSEPISQKEAESIIEKIEPLWAEISIAVISDYAKGFLTEFFLSRLIMQGGKNKKLILVDPKGKDFAKYKGASVLTPNRREAAEAAHLDESGSDLVKKAGRKLLEDLTLEALLITQGEDGMTLFENKSEVFHLPASARQVYDVTGAGDTVIGSFAAGIAAGMNYLEAAKFANLAAGLVVEHIGTTAINVEMLRNFFNDKKI